jgi:hypothetical protein
MATPVWKGSTKIEEQPGSPKYTESGSGEKVVRTFRGPYSTLFGTRPRKGGTMTGYDGFVIDEVYLEPDGAGPDGPGTMTVTLLKDLFFSTATDAVEEIEYTEITKPAEQAPIFAPGGAKELTDTDLDRIADWKAAGTAAERTRIYAEASANAKYFITKLKRGQDSYVVFAPVYRRTRKSYNPPTTTRCGRKVAKPGPCPAGYEWFQSADRRMRQGGAGKWEYVTEITGVDRVDTDFYPPG